MAAPATGAAAGLKLGSLSSLSMPAKVAICVLLPGLLGLLYFVVFYNDLTTKIETAQRQQTSLKNDLSAQQQAQASYLADRDELALRQQRQREFNKVLPATAESAAFLSAVQQVSNVSGVDLEAWRPEPIAMAQYYAKVPMRLEMKGYFHQVLKFAHEIGKVDRIINLENIELKLNPASKEERALLNVRCLATAFHAIQATPEKKR